MLLRIAFPELINTIRSMIRLNERRHVCRYRWLLVAITGVMLLTACSERAGVRSGPRLLSEVTVGAANEEPLPTLVVTATPVRVTPEIISPLNQVTVDADFVLVTPTLPPSKTPTITPTHTYTPTQTLTPTSTSTATATGFFFPTSVIIPLTQPVAAPVNRVCDSTWFFIQPRPDNCPLNPPTASQGVFQSFQNGYMVWAQSLDAIYVLYNDPVTPRWQVFRDFFQEGMPERTSEYDNAPGPGLWQPRRGFGLLWRNNAAIRQRIGWATIEWEIPYSTQLQTADDGTIFVSQPGPAVFALMPNGITWNQYSSQGNLPGIARTPGQLLVPGSVPLPTLPPGS